MKQVFWLIILLLLIVVNLVIGQYFLTNKEGMISGNQQIPKDENGNYLSIPNGYYISGDGLMSPIPYGYVSSPDNKSIYPISSANIYDTIAKQETIKRGFSGGYAGSGKVITDTCFNNLNYLGAPTESSYNDLTHYNRDNYNLQYHDTIDNISKQDDLYDLSFGVILTTDGSGNVVGIPRTKIQGNITYYEPGAYRFGASTYVPSYEDSVYLTRTNGKSLIDSKNATAISPSEINGGFCSTYKLFPEKIEDSCSKISNENCASTSCCVLLGGSKCVAGNETGPLSKTNYSDMFIRNKDYYYYQGKCYGNCNK